MNVYRKLLSQTAIYGLSSIIGRIINWALTPLYVNHFSVEEYGIFSDLYALTFFPLIIITFGLETAFFRFASSKEEAEVIYANAFYTVLGLAFTFLLLGLLFQKPLLALLGYSQAPHYVLLMLGVIFWDTTAALPLAKLRYENKALRFATIALLNIFLTLALNILFVVVLKLDLTYVFIANLLASGVRLAISLWNNAPSFAAVRANKIKQLMSYGFFIMLAGLAGAINETLDRALIPRLWAEGFYHGVRLNGLEMNGIYGANYKLGMFITLVTQAFRYAAEPLFFKKANQMDAPIIFAKIFHYYAIAAQVMVLVISLFAYEIVSFDAWGLMKSTLIPSDYWMGLEAVPFILLANFFLGIYLNLSIWFKLSNQVHFGFILAGSGALITIVFNIITIPYWGYMGAAYATSICYGFMAVACYILGQKYYPIPYRILRLVGYGVFGFVLYLIIITHLETLNAPGFAFLKLFAIIFWILVIFIYEKIRPLKW
ncbi:MAG: oligosaccharide flippase family protein [Bacteroidia bacterium]|nr:oligosaccharide flippase family protein [Bacteroidia bacterium]